MRSRRRRGVAVFDDHRAGLRVVGSVGGLPGGKAVDIAVEHAERCGDEHRVVDLRVARAGRAGVVDGRLIDRLASSLHQRRDVEERSDLRRDRLGVGIGDHGVDARRGEALLWSVGCYELEGEGVQLFDRIEGDYFTILGLPLLKLLAALREFGINHA